MRKVIALAAAVVFSTLPLLANTSEDAPGGLKVGFAQADITPPAGAIMTGPALPQTVAMEDPLFARALVARSGGRTVAIVGLDLVKIRRDLADAAIEQAFQRTGIDRDAVLICPSHNHSSPFIPAGGPKNQDYLSTLPGIIADVIKWAHQALQPARMFLGRSLVYEGPSNRRVISKADGLALNTWLRESFSWNGASTSRNARPFPTPS